MQALFQDIRYSVRMLLKNPGFTAVAVMTLAIGIGANSIIFCVAKSMMFPPLPFRDVGRILRLTQSHRESGGFASSIPDYFDWKAQNHVFSQIAAVSYGWSTISGGTEPEEVDTAFVSEDFFELLGVGPQAGRLFFPEEYRPGAERVMILANAFWQRQFGGRTDALGRQLTLSGESYTIVGIMPPGFEGQFFTRAFLPLSARKDTIPTDRTNRRSGVFARLKSEVTLDQARRAMAIMVGVFAFVALLLATVGTYGVMAYSVSERTPEIGIRMALGAQRGDALALVLKHGIRLLLIGLPLGLGGALALSGILKSQLFGVAAGDPVTLVGVSMILAGVAISACYLPARRAARVDPMVALRYE